MSDVWGENLPILYGRSVATGELVHVDDAPPNGKACGWVRPDPGCGQPLIARNNGKKIRRFVRVDGACTVPHTALCRCAQSQRTTVVVPLRLVPVRWGAVSLVAPDGGGIWSDNG